MPFSAAAPKSGPCLITGKDVEGPYYKPYAPFKPLGPEWPAMCKSSVVNNQLFISGNVSKLVRGSAADVCEKVPVKVLLDVWAADQDGIYSDTSPSSPDYVSNYSASRVTI